MRTLVADLIQRRMPIPGFIPMAEANGYSLYTDGSTYFTARYVHDEVLDVHRHAHRDAAVDDFRARAGLLKEARR